jgi:hypothetical protein
LAIGLIAADTPTENKRQALRKIRRLTVFIIPVFWNHGSFKSSSLETMRSLVIVGAGCAANTAAIYSARAGLKPLVLEGPHAGGQISSMQEVAR